MTLRAVSLWPCTGFDLPETLKERLIFGSRFEDGAWVKGRTFEENKEKVLMLEVSIRYKL